MKKILSVLFISVLGFASCTKEEPQPLTKEQIKQKIDSITNVRIKQSDEMAQIDLERRMKIEVKIKVDSIVNAKQQKETRDTVKPVANIPVPNSNSQAPKPRIPGLIQNSLKK